MGYTVYRSCSICESGCGLAIRVEDGRVAGIRGDKDDFRSQGYTCPKSRALADLHEDPDRLRTPVIRRNGQWESAGWDEALDFCGRRMSEIRKRHGRHALAT
ncbi:MAG: molybdopterin-dependent oxidoreductase, partial [Proteobacteria bacterium]|nr:molybdopterin-dependent oxidoreductase [Pseudomonadota bacterium]